MRDERKREGKRVSHFKKAFRQRHAVREVGHIIARRGQVKRVHLLNKKNKKAREPKIRQGEKNEKANKASEKQKRQNKAARKTTSAHKTVMFT